MRQPKEGRLLYVIRSAWEGRIFLFLYLEIYKTPSPSLGPVVRDISPLSDNKS